MSDEGAKQRQRRRRLALRPAAKREVTLEWYDLESLTSYAALSRNTIRELIRDSVDPLPASQLRGKIYVHKSDFDAYLRRHPVKPMNLDAVVKEVLEGMAHGR